MPVYSMTGYATGHRPAPESAGASAPGVGMEIRSVNSRFLDVSMRLNDELRNIEPALRERVGQHLKRGKVEIRAWIEGRDNQSLGTPAAADLQRLLAAQDQVRAWLPQARDLSVNEVLGLLARQTPASNGLGDEALALADELLVGFTESRAREGAKLTAMLTDRTHQLRELARQAEPLVPQLVQQQRQRFLDRWNEALGHTGADTAMAQDRALAEATAFAIRIDVAEEITRLQAHLDEIDRLLAKGGEVGKRLDFFIQELHREANTLGSKSSSLELTHISVDMKVLIEQMREQVQNLE